MTAVGHTKPNACVVPPVVKLPLLAILILSLSPIVAAQDAPLTLERAVTLAVERNERAAIAETTVEAAEARVSRARTAFFPSVDITGNWRNDYAEDTAKTGDW